MDAANRWRTRAAVLLIAAACIAAPPGSRATLAQTRADHFPDVELRTQHDARVRFQDLIRGKKVLIELIYTSCTFACPLETARLAQVQTVLGDRMGRDVFFFSISIDPEHDTPAVLRAFAEKYHAGPGWTFVTGARGDIDRLAKALGLAGIPDPSNQDGHAPLLLLGNEATGQWTRVSALDNPRLTASMITNWFGGYSGAAPRRSYAEAKPIGTVDTSAHLFATRCAACHTLGGGAGVGPDLAGVTSRRDPAWLAEYIARPDRVLARGDPIAKALFAEHKQVQMPNLGLTDEEVQGLIAYLARTGTQTKPAGSVKGGKH